MTYSRASQIASSLLSVHCSLFLRWLSSAMPALLPKVIFPLITHPYGRNPLTLAYACALSRDILIQGRVYLGQCHVCFYANILGWVTSVVISLNDIVSIEKRSTALIFPNAIQISTLHYRYIFASFLSRDDAYNHLIMAWRQAIGTTVCCQGEEASFSIRRRPVMRTGTYTLTHQKSLEGTFLEGGGSTLQRGQSLLPPPTRQDVFSDDVLFGDGGTIGVPEKGSQSFEYKGEGLLRGPPVILMEEPGLKRDGESLCACRIHYPCLLLSRTIEISLSTLHSLLFDTSNPFMGNLFAALKFRNCTLWTEGSWQILSNGEEGRTYSLDILLPTLMGPKEYATVKFYESYMSKSVRTRYVVEASVEIMGLPGGPASVQLRLCLVAKGDGQASLLITADAHPPRAAWFKQSIRRALLSQMAGIYYEVGQALERYSANARHLDDGGEHPRPTSWWKSSGALHPRESRESLQFYFDWAAFRRSLIYVIPFVGFLLASAYGRHRSTLWSEGEGSATSEERISAIKSELSRFWEHGPPIVSIGRDAAGLIQEADEAIIEMQRQFF